MSKTKTIWKYRPDPEDYTAAHDFLSLIFSERETQPLVQKLRHAPTMERAAKDILRAARCGILEKDNPHVAADLRKISKGKKISPVLLVRGNGRMGAPLIIADGYHRICAGWYWEENLPVACCMVGVAGRS